MRHARSHSGTRLWRTPLAVILACVLAATGAILFTTNRADGAGPLTIWGREAPSGVILDDDLYAVELGTEFMPTTDGQVTGIRFYKVAGVTGTHVGTLWASNGKKLATVVFRGESEQGWQEAALSTPVKVVAGKRYTVSYRVPAGGRYATTVGFKGTSQSTQLSVARSNSGVYNYGSRTTSPAKTWRSSQYWADVAFVPVAAGVRPSPAPSATSPASPSPAATPTSRPTATPTPSATAKPTPTATATPTPTPSVTAKPTPTSTPTAQPSPSATAVPTPSTGYPTAENSGLPVGWTPKQSVTGTYYVRTAGAVVEDLRITDGTIVVLAPDVTLRRIDAVGSNVLNGQGSTCYANLLVQDSDFTPNGATSDQDQPVIQYGGYTADNVMIDGVPEGLRVGGTDIGCGAVTIKDSFIRVTSPDRCTDWHGDGIQGYGGSALTVRNTTIIMDVRNNCYGTAPFFYPKNQGNTSVDIDGLLVGGGGYAFRNGMPGSVKNLKVIDGSWVYGPVDVNCSVLSAWQAQVVKVDSSGQPVSTVRSIGCTGEGN